MAIKGLSAEESDKLRSAILQRESSGDYQVENRFGFVGGYQFGAAALEDVGLVKRGIGKLGNDALNNDANWTIPGGKEGFKSNPQLQDQSFYKLANQNVRTLERVGVITGATPPSEIGGLVAAAHLTGAGGAIALDRGNITLDANGTTSQEYFGLGKSAVSLAAANPADALPSSISEVVPTGVTLGVNPVVPGLPAIPSFSPSSLVGDNVQVYTSGEVQTEEAPGALPNPLQYFSSYNYVFTLSCLTSKQINFPEAPDSYKGGNALGNIIFRSGGGFPDNRVTTAYTSPSNPSGKFEYYIESAEIEVIMSYNKESKGSNATNISFEVIEPYSMGMFLQSMQLAAVEAFHKNYLEAPFLLTLEFLGFTTDGTVSQIPLTKRQLPLKISNVSMNITESGCKYEVSCYPWNEAALTDTFNSLKSDIAVSGTKLSEILQTGPRSLQFYLNSQLQELNKKEKVASNPDEIVILFPTLFDPLSNNAAASYNTEDTGQPATINPSSDPGLGDVQSKLSITRAENALLIQDPGTLNEIGLSDMGFDANTGGESQAEDSNKVQPDGTKPPSRQSNIYDPKNKVFRFPQNTTIVNAITEIVLMSEYCKQAAEKESGKAGFKKWFRVETKVYNLQATSGNDGKGYTPKLLVYQVVPYFVHENRFVSPTSEPKGYEDIKKLAAKEYNYIYTGKNIDVLKFDINLEAGFFTTVYADNNALSGDQYPQLNGQGTTPPNNKNVSNTDLGAQEPGTGVARKGFLAERYRNIGGGPNDDYRSLVAKNFQEALLNSPVDLLTATLEIMGDPYYIADSGMGNFTDKAGSFNIASNGSINYQTGEVDILLNFRTPIDYGLNGIMDFGNTEIVQGFSGLYQVLTVKNRFSGGTFIQELEVVRRRNQNPSPTLAGDSANANGDSGGTATTTPGAAKAKPSNASSGDLGRESQSEDAETKEAEVPGQF